VSCLLAQCVMSHAFHGNRRTIVKTPKAKALEAAQENKYNCSRYAVFPPCVMHLVNNVSLVYFCKIRKS
jgi:hypothetical protein